MISAEFIDCADLPPGSLLEVETKNRHYQIECLGGSAIRISGHPEYCPTPAAPRPGVRAHRTWKASPFSVRRLPASHHLARGESPRTTAEALLRHPLRFVGTWPANFLPRAEQMSSESGGKGLGSNGTKNGLKLSSFLDSLSAPVPGVVFRYTYRS
jgi:hypothetical protein